MKKKPVYSTKKDSYRYPTGAYDMYMPPLTCKVVPVT